MPPNKQISDRAPALKLGDIYYILFRQKRWIIACTVAGLVAAGIVFILGRPGYQSEAKLLVRYVLESKSPSPSVTDSQIRSPDLDGKYIINTEVEILESFDLSKQVVDAVGIEKIVPGLQGPDARDEAAAFVNKNLIVQAPSMSSVIRVVFQHPDREVVQPVLRETIKKYLKKHINIHQGSDDFLTQQVEKLQSQLARTEQELYTEQISKTHREIFDSQSELAERQAALRDMTNAVPDSLKPGQSNPAGEYKSLLTRLDQLSKKRQDLLSQFTEGSLFVKEVNQQIAEAEVVKKNLEAENPQLANLQGALLTAGDSPSALLVEPSAVSARITALESKIQAQKSQLVSLRSEAVDTAADKTAVNDSQRGKEPDESSDQHLSASLEEARFDEVVRNSKDSDISVIQSPSPPTKATSKIYKMMAETSLGGFGLGLVLAFFFELKLDQSVRRPVDVLTKLRLPLYLCIPRAQTNGHNHVGEDAGGTLTTRGNGSSKNRVLDRLPSLYNYYEALRAKLLMDFEIRNLVHKPKLLAVTSCNQGAGVTTVAVGLAACLSQTGDGKVLLVDVTQEKAIAHQFLNGKPVDGLDEALPDAEQAERLDGGSQARNVARQMSHLMPKLKASSYDYIIFDMPPISQTSITLRLAGLVDTVVLVLESEKTNRGLALHATAELAESKAHVCAVLNKTQTHVPRQLHHEFLGDS